MPRMAAYADGRRDVATWEQFRNAPVGMPLAETVLRTGEPMTADNDSGLLSGWWVDNFDVASGLAVPLGRSPRHRRGPHPRQHAGAPVLRGRPPARRRRRRPPGRRHRAGPDEPGPGRLPDHRRRRPAAAGRRRPARPASPRPPRWSPAPSSGWPAPTAAPPTCSATTAPIGEVRHVDWPDAHRQVVQTRLVGRPAADVALWRLTARSSCRSSSRTPATGELLDPRLVARTRPGLLRQRAAAVRRPPARAGRHRLGVGAPQLVARRPGGRPPGDPRGRAGRRERDPARGRAAPAGSSWRPRRTTTR